MTEKKSSRPLTATQVGERLGLSPGRVSELFQQGLFPGAWQNGPKGAIRIPEDGLRAFIDNNRPDLRVQEKAEVLPK